MRRNEHDRSLQGGGRQQNKYIYIYLHIECSGMRNELILWIQIQEKGMMGALWMLKPAHRPPSTEPV